MKQIIYFLGYYLLSLCSILFISYAFIESLFLKDDSYESWRASRNKSKAVPEPPQNSITELSEVLEKSLA